MRQLIYCCAGILLSTHLAACAVDSVPQLNQRGEAQEETRGVQVTGVDTCGFYGAFLGYRQYELACLYLSEDTPIGPGAPCPTSLRLDENGNEAEGAQQRCEIFSAVADPDNGQWDGMANATSDCTICAFYSEDANNRPQPLRCDDPNNTLTGIFQLGRVDIERSESGPPSVLGIREAWLLLFQSTRGVRGVVCENEHPDEPGVANCSGPNPEVAGFFDQDGKLRLTKYEYIRKEDSDAVIEVRTTPLFAGRRVENAFWESHDDFARVLQYVDGKSALCAAFSDPNF